jgi:hypothetical protein
MAERSFVMSKLKSDQKSTPPKSERTYGPLQSRAERFVEACMPPGQYDLTRIYWKEVSDKLDCLEGLAGQTDNAVVLISSTKDAVLAVGVAPARVRVNFEANFEAFFRNSINNRNLLGARSVRLGLPDGSAIFLLPIGGINGSFEDVFRPAKVSDPGTSLSEVLADLTLAAEKAEAAADRVDASHREAIAAAEMAEQATHQATTAAAEAGEVGKSVEDVSRRANAARDGLEETLDRVQQTTTRLRAIVFGEVAP